MHLPTPLPNNPPSIATLSLGFINQGGIFSTTGSFTDSDSLSWTATVDYGDGSGVQPLSLSGQNFTITHLYNTPGTFTITVAVTDNQRAVGTATTTVTVNAAPQIAALSGGSINTGDTYTENGSFTDADSTSWSKNHFSAASTSLAIVLSSFNTLKPWIVKLG